MGWWNDTLNYLEGAPSRTAGMFGGGIGCILGGPSGCITGYKAGKEGARDIVKGLRMLPFKKGGLVRFCKGGVVCGKCKLKEKRKGKNKRKNKKS